MCIWLRVEQNGGGGLSRRECHSTLQSRGYAHDIMGRRVSVSRRVGVSVFQCQCVCTRVWPVARPRVKREREHGKSNTHKATHTYSWKPTRGIHTYMHHIHHIHHSCNNCSYKLVQWSEVKMKEPPSAQGYRFESVWPPGLHRRTSRCSVVRAVV